MPPSSDKSYIDELKKTLYSRSAPDIRTKRKLRFDPVETDMKKDWEHPPDKPLDVELNKSYKDNAMSFFTKILIGSSLFCIAAVGIGAFMFFNGANLISADNIDIVISGPVSIAGGDPIIFDITAVNKNNIDLELVDLSVEFPMGTTDATDPGKQLQNYRKLLGSIPAGKSVKESVTAIIFGEENVEKQIEVSLTYSVKGSSSVFTKRKSYDILVTSSPVNMAVNSFKEVTSGQEFEMKLEIKSNSDQDLKNLILKAQYPFGYVLTGSSIVADSDNSTWKIGDLPPGRSRSITFRGKLSGEDSDVRTFRFSVGTQSSKDPNAIGTQFNTIAQDITIERPFVSLGIVIDNDSGTSDHIGEFGRSQRVEITWFNNLPVAVSNMTIIAKLSGTAYDKNSVRADLGVFDSMNNTITWNGRSDPRLGSVAAGDNGTVSFTIVPKDLGTAQNPVINPTITYEVSVSGNRPQEDNVPSQISSAAIRSTRVAPTVSLAGRVVRSVGPFANTGPIPPKAEQTTTYTVIWSVNNTSSAVGNAQVIAMLPAYVKWLGASSPSSEELIYDPNTGKLTWNVGNIGTYTLTSSRRREVAFQIALTPNVTQADQYLTLVEQATLNAVDNFTGKTVTSSQEYLTTRFSTDPAYKEGDETISR